jgi:hypothetical protein
MPPDLAGGPIEKKICDNLSIKAAEAAMGQTYSAPLKRHLIPKSGRCWQTANVAGLQHATMGPNDAVIPVGEIHRAMVECTDRLSDRSDKGNCRAGSGTMQSSSINTIG